MYKHIPTDVIKALEVALKSDIDSCARVITFLSTRIEDGSAEPYISSLQSVMYSPMLFKKVAENMAEDTKTAKENPKYVEMMYDVWNKYLQGIDINDPDGGKKLALVIRPKSNYTVAQFSFLKAVSSFSPESLRALATTARAMGGQVAVYGGRALAIAQSTQPVVRVALVTVYLAADVIMNIRRWWNGDISGVRCAKNILDCGVGVAAGIGGGVGGEIIGASVGSIFGPVGTAIGAVSGAVIGGAFAATTAESLCDRLTQWMFGLPKEAALENAFNFLQLSPYASNMDINKQFKHLALKYHPDKGGDAEKWQKLQISMTVIKEARRERK